MSEELARRAVACRHWRWAPGMLIKTVGGPTDRIAGIDSTYIHAWAESQQTENPRGMWIRYRLDRMNKHGVPDLSDPATVGALLALVREAVEPQRAPGDWPIVCTYQSQAKQWGVGAWLNESGKATFAALVLPTYETEAAALVAALEAAP